MKYSKKRRNTKIHKGTKTKKHRKISTKNKKQYQVGGINPEMEQCLICFEDRQSDDMWSFHDTTRIDNRHCVCSACMVTMKIKNRVAICPFCTATPRNNSVYRCSAPYTLVSVPITPTPPHCTSFTNKKCGDG